MDRQRTEGAQKASGNEKRSPEGLRFTQPRPPRIREPGSTLLRVNDDAQRLLNRTCAVGDQAFQAHGDLRRRGGA